MTGTAAGPVGEDDVARWRAAWPQALGLWGRSLRLQDPVLLTDPATSQHGRLAWFDLARTSVTVDLVEAARLGLLDQALVVLGHEVGHHVLAPGDRTTSARVLARCRAGLLDRADLAPLVANLWTDTLVNDRLARSRGLDMAAVYRTGPPPRDDANRLWMRGFELLWRLPTGSLSGGPLPPDLDADGLLLSRHARVYARDVVGGAAGFALLLRRWLPDPDEHGRGRVPPSRGCAEDRGAGAGAPYDGLADDDALAAPVVHPGTDPRVNPEAGTVTSEASSSEPVSAGTVRAGGGQAFGPSDLAELYSALGSTRDAALDWYVARARPHLVPFPTTRRPHGPDPELQGLHTWEVGDDLADVDWLASVTASPTVLPGRTTLRRVVDDAPPDDPRPLPVDLDLYVDSSGSMPPARQVVSPTVLAGAVLVLSALRAGARVQVTVWSSAGQVARTPDGPTRDRDLAMTTLLHHWGGGTTFPLRRLLQDHPPRTRPRPPWEPATHLAVLSDDGVVSMFGVGQWSGDRPEPGLEGAAATALASAGGGGSLVLQLDDAGAERVRALAGDYRVFAVPTDDELVPFAAWFARETWGGAGDAGAGPGARMGR